MLKHGRGDLQKKAGAELDSHIAKAIALLTSSASAALLPALAVIPDCQGLVVGFAAWALTLRLHESRSSASLHDVHITLRAVVWLSNLQQLPQGGLGQKTAKMNPSAKCTFCATSVVGLSNNPSNLYKQTCTLWKTLRIQWAETHLLGQKFLLQTHGSLLGLQKLLLHVCGPGSLLFCLRMLLFCLGFELGTLLRSFPL